jgi:CRISPR-associated protein Cmr1
MPKNIPGCPKKPDVTRENSHEFDFELLTPMFGGGVEPRINDPSCPIRATAVRGQLEFWWRATRGSRYRSVQELRTAQSDLWGSTDRSSRVQVAIAGVIADAPAPCARFRWDPRAYGGRGRWQTEWEQPFGGRDSALPYAPPDPNASATVPPASCIRRASFRLIIRCPKELWAEVESAVWAWGNFGGLGGRTRRGCGAVLCKTLAPPSAEHFKAWLHASATRYELTLGAGAAEWPQFSEGIWYLPTGETAVTAWDRLIWTFRQFRQGQDVGRNPGSPRPGRSRFPEPESIRRHATGTNRSQSGHQRLPQIPDDAFPRAELGLPIVFHFQGRGEPGDTTLYPVVGGKMEQRMGSPLLLRPVATADGKAVAVIVKLRTPPLTGVELTGRPIPRTAAFGPAAVHRPNLATYPDSPLAGSPSGSAIEAFLAFTQNADNNFRRV